MNFLNLARFAVQITVSAAQWNSSCFELLTTYQQPQRLWILNLKHGEVANWMIVGFTG